jgi:hypothetical protein
VRSCLSKESATSVRSKRWLSAAVGILTQRGFPSCRLAVCKPSAASSSCSALRGWTSNWRGLCDAAEEGHFRRGLERAGLGSNLTRADMERLGFYVCVADLEDELVRYVRAAAVEQVIAAEGELGSFRTFQKQPAKRELTYEEQLWRFMWNRKARYATLLVHSLDLDRVPRPLDGVLAHV